MKECKVFLKPKKEESLLRFHPWVFSGAIQTIEGEPEEGDLVEVYGTNGRFLGIGHYQIGSIAVRILSFKPVTIDAAFWEERIRIAYTLRQTLELAGVENNNTYRLVHGEGDNLPGLVIDMYAHTAVMQGAFCRHALCTPSDCRSPESRVGRFFTEHILQIGSDFALQGQLRQRRRLPVRW